MAEKSKLRQFFEKLAGVNPNPVTGGSTEPTGLMNAIGAGPSSEEVIGVTPPPAPPPPSPPPTTVPLPTYLNVTNQRAMSGGGPSHIGGKKWPPPKPL